MKKKPILIGLFAFILLFLMITIDYQLAKSNKPPIFSLRLALFKDGGTSIYQGLGYKVVDYNQMSGRQDVVFIPFYSKEEIPD